MSKRRGEKKDTVIVDWEQERLPNSIRRQSIQDRPENEADIVFDRKREKERRKNKRREERVQQ